MAGFTWRDYLQVAKALNQEPTDAAQRTAVTRAYYAVYGPADERRIAAGLEKGPGSGAQEKLWADYLAQDNADRKRVGDLGKRLLARRLRADYKLNMKNPGREAVQATSEAEALLAKLDAL